MLRQRGYETYLALAAVGVIGLGVAGSVDAFWGAGEALKSDVRAALGLVPPPPTGGLDIVHACFKYSDLIRGQQIALLLFLLGGVPCALTGAALLRACRTGIGPAANWCSYLHAGLVFQLCSLTLTSFLLTLLTIFAVAFEPSALIHPSAAILGLLVACNIWGVALWRELQWEASAALLRWLP
ncbi:MAG TPA: hypothetical protein VG106_03485 [Vicinamibacterales bacterium]|nr:hypothetical protein [Vicinamibacterales bacterium]